MPLKHLYVSDSNTTYLNVKYQTDYVIGLQKQQEKERSERDLEEKRKREEEERQRKEAERLQKEQEAREKEKLRREAEERARRLDPNNWQSIMYEVHNVLC